MTLSIPASVWRSLPSLLKSLDLHLCLFESEKCFNSLPGNVKELVLDLSSSDDYLERSTFTQSLQRSLEKPRTYSGRLSGTPDALTLESLFSQLREFYRISSIHIGTKIVIKSKTLAYLPKTLTKLRLDCEDFENFGLTALKKIVIGKKALYRGCHTVQV